MSRLKDEMMVAEEELATEYMEANPHATEEDAQQFAEAHAMDRAIDNQTSQADAYADREK